MDRVEELAAEFRKAQPTDTPFGAHTLTAEEVAAFMERKELEQPGYIRALAFVEGGMAWISQFEKARGLR